MLAAALHARARPLSDRVAAVFTFAAPRYGDDEFAAAFNTAYAGRAFRYVHASDMVCKLPPAGCGYGAAAAQRFITSFSVDSGSRLSGSRSLPFGRRDTPTHRPTATRSASGRILREEDDPDRVRFWTAWEDRGAWLFSAAKLARAATRGDEPRVRTALRAALLAVPGFSDHFLCDYERALRQELMAQQAQAAAAAAAVAVGAAAPEPLPATTASPFATVQVVSRSTAKATPVATVGLPPSGGVWPRWQRGTKGDDRIVFLLSSFFSGDTSRHKTTRAFCESARALGLVSGHELWLAGCSFCPPLPIIVPSRPLPFHPSRGRTLPAIATGAREPLTKPYLILSFGLFCHHHAPPTSLAVWGLVPCPSNPPRPQRPIAKTGCFAFC